MTSTNTQPKHTLPLYECVLCKDEYMGYGNNAAPVAEGKCCDNCNFTQVISARLVKSTKQTKMMTTDDIDTEIEALTQRLADLKAMKRNLEVEDEIKTKRFQHYHHNTPLADLVLGHRRYIGALRIQKLVRGWIVRNKEEPRFLCECCFEAPWRGLSCDKCSNPCCADCVDSAHEGWGTICSECIAEGEECEFGCANRWHIDEQRQCDNCGKNGCDECVEWSDEYNEWLCSECLEDMNEEQEEEEQEG